MAVGNYLAIKT